jgi:hypothetical protein
MTDFSPKEIFLKERLVSLEGNNPPSPLKEIQTDIDYDPKTRQDRFGNRYYFSPDNKSFLGKMSESFTIKIDKNQAI